MLGSRAAPWKREGTTYIHNRSLAQEVQRKRRLKRGGEAVEGTIFPALFFFSRRRHVRWRRRMMIRAEGVTLITGSGAWVIHRRRFRGESRGNSGECVYSRYEEQQRMLGGVTYPDDYRSLQVHISCRNKCDHASSPPTKIFYEGKSIYKSCVHQHQQPQNTWTCTMHPTSRAGDLVTGRPRRRANTARRRPVGPDGKKALEVPEYHFFFLPPPFLAFPFPPFSSPPPCAQAPRDRRPTFFDARDLACQHRTTPGRHFFSANGGDHRTEEGHKKSARTDR